MGEILMNLSPSILFLNMLLSENYYQNSQAFFGHYMSFPNEQIYPSPVTVGCVCYFMGRSFAVFSLSSKRARRMIPTDWP